MGEITLVAGYAGEVATIVEKLMEVVLLCGSSSDEEVDHGALVEHDNVKECASD